MAQRDYIEETRAIVPDDSDSSDSTVTAHSLSGPRYCKCLTTSHLLSNSHDSILLVYYRLFTESIGIPSAKPAFPCDPYLGRVRANSVAPPQTVHLIKRRLCQIENKSDYLDSILFVSRSSLSPINNTERVSILTPGGPGSTPDEPMELVVKSSLSDYQWSGGYDSKQAMSPTPQYSAGLALSLHSVYLHVFICSIL